MCTFKPNREKIIKQLEDRGYNFYDTVTEYGNTLYVFHRNTAGVKSGEAAVVFNCEPLKDPTMFAAIIPDDNKSLHIPLVLYPYELQLFAKFMRTLK